MSIVRDKDGIIIQHSPFDKSYADGGDSCMKVSMNALAGSTIDILTLPFFLKEEGLGVRHPTEVPYNSTRTFTRDQLLPLVAASYSYPPMRRIASSLFISHAKRAFFCQNDLNQDLSSKPWYSGRDPLHLGHIMVMAKAGGFTKTYWTLFIPGSIFLYLEYLFNVYVNPNRESNQAIALFSVAGDFWLKRYCKNHPNWKRPIVDYWDSWRNEKEIGENIIKYVLTRISR